MNTNNNLNIVSKPYEENTRLPKIVVLEPKINNNDDLKSYIKLELRKIEVASEKQHALLKKDLRELANKINTITDSLNDISTKLDDFE
jgi:hypothetical protein